MLINTPKMDTLQTSKVWRLYGHCNSLVKRLCRVRRQQAGASWLPLAIVLADVTQRLFCHVPGGVQSRADRGGRVKLYGHDDGIQRMQRPGEEGLRVSDGSLRLAERAWGGDASGEAHGIGHFLWRGQVDNVDETTKVPAPITHQQGRETL